MEFGLFSPGGTNENYDFKKRRINEKIECGRERNKYFSSRFPCGF
jgi:hypothetical protein